MALPFLNNRVRTPTFLQMEAVECGAAALGIVLRYYGKYIPLEELRIACGVTRDGSNAANMVKAAQQYGMQAKGMQRRNLLGLQQLKPPYIIFWNFNHFLVVEGIGRNWIYLNDPAQGPRRVSHSEFDEKYTGVVITVEPGPEFKRTGEKFSIVRGLRQRLTRSELGLIYVILISLLLVIPGLIIPAFLRVFVDDILIARKPWISELLAVMGFVVFMRLALTWLQQMYILRLETKLALNSSSQFFWHILRLPMDFFSQRFAGDIAYRVQLNDQIAQLLSGEMTTTIIDVLLIVFFGVVMWTYSVELTLASIVIALLNVLVLRYFARRSVDASQRLLSQNGRLIGSAMNGLSIIETIKATGAESDFFARWAGFFAQFINADQDAERLTQLITVIPPLLMGVNVATVLVLGASRILSGQMTVGTLVAFQSLMTSFSEPVIRLVNLGSRFQQAGATMARLDDVLNYPRDDYNFDLETISAGLVQKLEGHLELKNLTFGYSRLEAPLIQDFSLTIRPGERIAIVGTSGSGKSTIAKLVSGLYEPWSGEILLDGKNRSTLPRSVLTASVSMVDQNIQLFNGTVRETLTQWNPTIPRSRVIQAAKDAHIHEVITAHTGGYDHPLGENGSNFSGGERQRLEIARALTSDPALLVLDEATSALDPITERNIDDNLRRRGCSVLIVAHRLSTIRDADEIIVLDKGKIVQRGTHKDLLAQDGPYAALVGAEKPKDEKRNVKSLLDKLL
jgi:NHLM bacteriocin system ABC transporter peptidase/ATP-binding protein